MWRARRDRSEPAGKLAELVLEFSIMNRLNIRLGRAPARAGLSLSLAAMVLSAAWAQPGAEQLALAATAPQLSEVLVTAARTAQPLTDVLADVTLIDRDQIAQSGAVTITDLLARQPGIELSRSGGPGTATGLFLRGAETRFTAVYIDGVRVDSQSTGGAPWEAIALGQVERIEIVRGPAAAVYGSDAVAGVVQIFTRQGEGPFAPYVGIGAGNRRTGKLEAGFSGKHGALDYSLGLQRDVSRGYDSHPGSNPDRDGYRQTSANGRLGLQLSDVHRVDLTSTYAAMDAQYDGFLPGLDDHGLNRLATLGASWSAQWSQAYSTRLSVSESQQRYEMVPTPYLSRTRLRNYLLQNQWKEGAHTLTGTLERREDHLANAPIDQSRHQDGLALGYGYVAGAHTVQLNLRHDSDSEFGGQTTGGVAYGFAFAPGWRATAAAGTAFRVPTLYQRFSEYGQPALLPEKGRNVEVGLHWAQAASRLGVTLYRTRVSNLINFGAPGACLSPFGCYENAGKARLQGMTLTAAHQVAGVNLSASLDLQQPKNLATGTLLARRAQRLLKVAADTRVAQWKLGAEWQLASHRWEDAANTSRLSGYGLVNLYASTTIARQWAVLVRVDNVGDRSYQLAQGYPALPRSFFVGLRWTGR